MTILFNSKTPEYAWLSNFSEDAFTLDGERWASVEHYYQAQKYVGTEAAERIRNAESPVRARKMGQDRSLTPRADWDDVKTDVMRRAVRAKFAAQRKLAARLLATEDEELVHTSGSDLFWGRTPDGDGENWLGRILMEVRQGLRDAAG